MAVKILLADDSMVAQNMGKKILADGGYELVVASNGSAAMKQFTEARPDIALLDVYMPGYTGLEVCQWIKTTAETASTPVLLTVGMLEPFRAEDGMRARADGVVIKPFEATDLLALVAKLVERLPQAKPRPVSSGNETAASGAVFAASASLATSAYDGGAGLPETDRVAGSLDPHLAEDAIYGPSRETAYSPLSAESPSAESEASAAETLTIELLPAPERASISSLAGQPGRGFRAGEDFAWAMEPGPSDLEEGEPGSSSATPSEAVEVERQPAEDEDAAARLADSAEIEMQDAVAEHGPACDDRASAQLEPQAEAQIEPQVEAQIEPQVEAQVEADSPMAAEPAPVVAAAPYLLLQPEPASLMLEAAAAPESPAEMPRDQVAEAVVAGLGSPASAIVALAGVEEQLGSAWAEPGCSAEVAGDIVTVESVTVERAAVEIPEDEVLEGVPDPVAGKNQDEGEDRDEKEDRADSQGDESRSQPPAYAELLHLSRDTEVLPVEPAAALATPAEVAGGPVMDGAHLDMAAFAALFSTPATAEGPATGVPADGEAVAESEPPAGAPRAMAPASEWATLELAEKIVDRVLQELRPQLVKEVARLLN